MSNKMITVTIDGETVTVPAGTTILELAEQLGKTIPTICYHEATTAKGLCRICVVDVNSGRVLQPACITPCQDGTEIETENARVMRARRTILEMLDSAVDLSQAPAIQDMLADYNADPQRFPHAKERTIPVIDDNPFYVRDYSQCVLCWRCVQVCAEDVQYTYALTLDGRGFNTQVSTTFHAGMLDSPCVFCGQCLGVCPTGALKSKIEWSMERGFQQEPTD